MAQPAIPQSLRHWLTMSLASTKSHAPSHGFLQNRVASFGEGRGGSVSWSSFRHKTPIIRRSLICLGRDCELTGATREG